MPLTVTGFASSPAAFQKAIERSSRRQISIQLRKGGQNAANIAQQLAGQRLGPSRVGQRRRNHGVSYHNGFEVKYTGLEDFAQGNMQIAVRNRAKHARLIEHGSAAHEIAPRNKTRLAWPPPPYNVGKPTIFLGLGQSVRHPGTRAYKILEDAARKGIIQGLGGRSMGHIRINIRMGGIR